MTNIDLIIDFHSGSERQGPGSRKDTLRALSFLNLPKNKELNMADIGCGTGQHAITLAQELRGTINAVDLFPVFLHQLDQKAKDLGLSDRINTLEASMENLPFEHESLDLIWSEGAIYNMGFEVGIKAWKDFLKSGAGLAVSEITWISEARPKELEDFWVQEYPEIGKASEKIKILEDNGFTLVGYFYLQPESWIESYYEPMESRFSAFLDKHHHSEEAQSVAQEYRDEIDLYTKYKDYFSYGFYIARKK